VGVTLEKPLEVVRRWPHWILAAVHIGRDASHTKATHLPITAVVVGARGPLKALLAPLATAFDALLGVVSGNIRWCLLVATRGCLPTSLCRAKHDHLVTYGMLGGDVVRLLECASGGVATSALPRALCMMLK
jgi:hypothetical protein